MKKLPAVAILITFAVTTSFAADTVVMKAKIGNVTFNHKAHSISMDCKFCHGEGTPGKLVMDKHAAHTLCQGCHTEKAAGPTTDCNGCHNK